MLTVDGKKIDIIQARKGIPCEKLYAATGLTRATVYSMKHGKPCKPLSVYRLAKALDVDVTEILKESEGTSND